MGVDGDGDISCGDGQEEVLQNVLTQASATMI